MLGGLGNQMFQLAFAKSLAIEHNMKIATDVSVYESYKIRSFSSDHLIISDEFEVITRPSFIVSLTHKLYRLYQKFVKDICGVEKHGRFTLKFLTKFGFIYNFDRFYYPTSLVSSRNIYLYGYFQSSKYFNRNIEVVKKSMKVKTTPTFHEEGYITQVSNSTSLAISMRLGDDYIKSKNLNVCGEEFYRAALDMAVKEIDNVKIFVFSDNIEKAKTMLSDIEGCIFIEGLKDYQSLRVMYSCKHFIISNSSFSWWGAFLGEYEYKRVYAPERWYNHMDKQPDIYFEDIIKIRCK